MITKEKKDYYDSIGETLNVKATTGSSLSDIETIVEKLDGILLYADILDSKITIRPDSFDITVKKRDTTQYEVNLTKAAICQAIATIIVLNLTDNPLTDNDLERETLSNIDEINYLTYAILMPKAKILNVINNKSMINIGEIASLFQVNKSQLFNRLEMLGLITRW